MSDRPRSIPSYRRHKYSGQAIVTLTDGLGGRRDVLLGKYNSKESRINYARVIAEWEATGHRLPSPGVASDLTVNELILAFWQHARQHYRRPDGTATNELADYGRTLRYPKELYGHTCAADFGPKALKAIRQRMMEDDLCRGVINQRVGRIKRLFKWAVSEELVPESVYSALLTVAGLPQGRTAARETEPVKPVPDAFVEAVLAFVLPPVRAMIQLQRVTGMRPGEACGMRACDLDTGGRVWQYKPVQHKMAYRGRRRVVAIGPRGQAIVKPFLTLDTQAHLFSPAQGLAERAVLLRANRKTPVQPSQQNRRKKNPRRSPCDRYTVTAYERAIIRGCDRADRHARQTVEDAKAEAAGREPVTVPAVVPDADRLIPRWAPNQLRHNHATDVRRQYGLEAAGASLGHAKMSVTEIYAERDETLALRVAAEIG